MCLIRYIIPIILRIFVAILVMCESHFKCLCIINQKKKNRWHILLQFFLFLSLVSLLAFEACEIP